VQFFSGILVVLGIPAYLLGVPRVAIQYPTEEFTSPCGIAVSQSLGVEGNFFFEWRSSLVTAKGNTLLLVEV